MCILLPRRRLRDGIPCPRLFALVASALVLAFGSFSAQANQVRNVPEAWGMHMLGVENCLGALGHVENEFTPVSDCVADRVFSSLASDALQFVKRRGKGPFGEHFHIDHRLGLTASTGTLSADLDVVIPLAALSSVEDDAVTRSLFIQNGVTRWRDAHGFRRSDMRVGVVHRSALFEQPDDGIVGTSMFVQENLERRHARVVTGIEYLDRWGQGSLTYYMPVTDWRPGRYGYEERALEGVELSYVTDLTNTIGLNIAAGRWESKDGSGEWTNRGRLDIGWQPHPWFELRGGWDDNGTGDDSMALRAAVTVPLGGGDWPGARWEGFGRRDLSSQEPDAGTMWRSVDHVGQVEVAERTILSWPDDEDHAEEEASSMLPLPSPTAIPDVAKWDDVSQEN